MVNAADATSDYNYKRVTENVLTKQDFWRVKGSDRSPIFIEFCQQLNLILEIEPDWTWRFVHLKFRDALAYGRAEKLLNDPIVEISTIAISAIGGVKDTRAVFQFLLELSDENRRYYVAAALVQIGDSSVVEGLIERLKDDDYHVRSTAAEALGEIKDSRATAGLLELLEDKEIYVRSTAVKALKTNRRQQCGERFAQPIGGCRWACTGKSNMGARRNWGQTSYGGFVGNAQGY